jgi:hypothetical protein
MPRMLVGAPQPAEPKDPKLLPRFPLAVIDDIPLNLAYGYTLAGQAEPAENHVEYFRKNGKLREHPLHPGDDPLSLLARLQDSPQWPYAGNADYEMGTHFLARQLLALVSSVYQVEPGSDTWKLTGRFDRQNWEIITKIFAQLHVKWDAQQNRYTFSDGTTLPEAAKPVYRRQIWYLPSLGPDARLVLEREDPAHVFIMLWHSENRGRKVEKTTITICRPWNKGHPLAQFDIPYSTGRDVSQESTTEIELEAGAIVQASAVSKAGTEQSPKLTP